MLGQMRHFEAETVVQYPRLLRSMLHIECVVWEQALQLACIEGSCSVLPKSSALDIAAAAAAASGAL